MLLLWASIAAFAVCLLPVAVVALERFGTSVFAVVPRQFVASCETPFTAFPGAFVRLLTCMHKHTSFNPCFTIHTHLYTDGAPLSTVSSSIIYIIHYSFFQSHIQASQSDHSFYLPVDQSHLCSPNLLHSQSSKCEKCCLLRQYMAVIFFRHQNWFDQGSFSIFS